MQRPEVDAEGRVVMRGHKLNVTIPRGIPGSTPDGFYAVLQIALPAAGSEAADAFHLHMAGQFPSFNPRAGLGV